MSEQIKTVQDALEYAAGHGVTITATDYKRMDEMQQQARQQLAEAEKQQEGQQGWIDWFNAHYPDFLRFMTGVFEVTITTGKTFIVGFGVLLGLILLVIVEQSRVKYGILLFEGHRSLADFGSIALVFFNTALEFTIHHVEHKHHYQEDRAVRNSLRLQWDRFIYWLGFSRKWRPAPLSPAHRYKQYQRLLTATILILATAGSMRDVISSQSGTWFEALGAIATQSSLANMATWLGGLLFAFAAVKGAQIATAYLAVVAREIEKNNHESAAANPGEDRAIQYILAKISSKKGTNSIQPLEHKQADFLAPLPAQLTPNGKNGNH